MPTNDRRKPRLRQLAQILAGAEHVVGVTEKTSHTRKFYWYESGENPSAGIHDGKSKTRIGLAKVNFSPNLERGP
jgi:hypothetical protein